MMSEETKAQKGESDKYPPAHITPLEIEEGRVVPSTEGRGPVKASAGEKTTCQRCVCTSSLGLRESVCACLPLLLDSRPARP